MLTSLITAAEETQSSSALSPIAIGAIALGLLLAMLVALLMFGKGREHS